MSFLRRLFGSPTARRRPSSALQPNSQLSQPHSQTPSQLHSQSPTATLHATRKELLRVVLRDTLHRSGIPSSWISADVLASARAREPGAHVRFLIRHWDPRLLRHGVAFQKSFLDRLLTLDPNAGNWLVGISWQFKLAAEAGCPPMPHPGIWTAAPPSEKSTSALVRGADKPQEAPADVRADLDALEALFGQRSAA